MMVGDKRYLIILFSLMVTILVTRHILFYDLSGTFHGIDNERGIVYAAECVKQSNTETDCSNNVDDDCDGYVDCYDSDCAGSSYCTGEDCSNGNDDNNNGLIDCADPACKYDSSCKVLLGQKGCYFNEQCISGICKQFSDGKYCAQNTWDCVINAHCESDEVCNSHYKCEPRGTPTPPGGGGGGTPPETTPIMPPKPQPPECSSDYDCGPDERCDGGSCVLRDCSPPPAYGQFYYGTCPQSCTNTGGTCSSGLCVWPSSELKACNTEGCPSGQARHWTVPVGSCETRPQRPPSISILSVSVGDCGTADSNIHFSAAKADYPSSSEFCFVDVSYSLNVWAPGNPDHLVLRATWDGNPMTGTDFGVGWRSSIISYCRTGELSLEGTETYVIPRDLVSDTAVIEAYAYWVCRRGYSCNEPKDADQCDGDPRYTRTPVARYVLNARKPVISATPPPGTYGSGKIVLDFSDDSGLAETGYYIGGCGQTPSYTSRTVSGKSHSETLVLDEGESCVYAYASDTSGNRREEVFRYVIDSTPPSVRFNPASEGWKNSSYDVRISFDGADKYAISVVTRGKDCPDPTETRILDEETVVQTISKNYPGTWTICAYAEDSAGNTVSEGSGPYLMDPDPPLISLEWYDKDGNRVGYRCGNTMGSPLVLRISATDELSGVASVNAYVDGSRVVTGLNGEIRLDDGVHDVRVVATDNAGNVAVETCDVVIDTSFPSVVAEPLDGISNSPVTVRLSVVNGNAMEYVITPVRGDPGSYIAGGSREDIMLYGEGEYYIYARGSRDSVIQQDVSEFGPYVIDTTPPEISAENPVDVSDGIDVSAEDNMLGYSVYLSIVDRDGKAIVNDALVLSSETKDRMSATFYPPSLDAGTYLLNVRATDKAGNSESLSIAFSVSAQTPEIASVNQVSPSGKLVSPDSVEFVFDITVYDSVDSVGIRVYQDGTLVFQKTAVSGSMEIKQPRRIVLAESDPSILADGSYVWKVYVKRPGSVYEFGGMEYSVDSRPFVDPNVIAGRICIDRDGNGVCNWPVDEPVQTGITVSGNPNYCWNAGGHEEYYSTSRIYETPYGTRYSTYYFALTRGKWLVDAGDFGSYEVVLCGYGEDYFRDLALSCSNARLKTPEGFYNSPVRLEWTGGCRPSTLSIRGESGWSMETEATPPYTFTPPSDGIYFWKVGSNGIYSGERWIGYDTTPPSVSVFYRQNGRIVDNPSPEKPFTVIAEASDSLSGVSSMDLFIAGRRRERCGFSPSIKNNPARCEFSIDSMPPGTYRVSVVARDAAGNVASSPSEFRVPDYPAYCSLTYNGSNYVIAEPNSEYPLELECFSPSGNPVQCPDMSFSGDYAENPLRARASSAAGHVTASNPSMLPCHFYYASPGISPPSGMTGVDITLPLHEVTEGESMPFLLAAYENGAIVTDRAEWDDMEIDRGSTKARIPVGRKFSEMAREGRHDAEELWEGLEASYRPETGAIVGLIDTSKYHSSITQGATISGNYYEDTENFTVITAISVTLLDPSEYSVFLRRTKDGRINATRGIRIPVQAEVRYFNAICQDCNVTLNYSGKAERMSYDLGLFHSSMDTSAMDCGWNAFTIRAEKGSRWEELEGGIYVDCSPLIIMNSSEISATLGDSVSVPVSVYNPYSSSRIRLSISPADGSLLLPGYSHSATLDIQPFTSSRLELTFTARKSGRFSYTLKAEALSPSGLSRYSSERTILANVPGRAMDEFPESPLKVLYRVVSSAVSALLRIPGLAG